MSQTPITAVCHVRAPLLFEPIDRQVETLHTCTEEGAVDELLLRSWPKEVTLSESTTHQEVIETYDRFSAWADQRGVSIEPPFRQRSTTSQISGTTTELLVTPLLCLELYAGDDLIGVFPHSVDQETYTSEEAIARLRTGELPTPLVGEPSASESNAVSIDEPSETTVGESNTTSVSEPSATAVGESNTTTTDCPACGGSLIDGQGLFACTDCRWVGTITEAGEYVSRSTSETSARYSATPPS